MSGVATMASCEQSIIELCAYANNKGADQPALKRSLISAFIVRCLNCMILLLYIYIADPVTLTRFPGRICPLWATL